jgi:DHA1 family bicyclomycin/chloramphenicol resistance-like MFS transporter
LAPAEILRFTVPVFVVVSLVLVGQVALGAVTLWSFVVNLMVFFVAFSLILGNGTAVALGPHKQRAGMASGLMGFAQLSLGTALGSFVAAFADQGPLPLALGLAGLSLLAYPALIAAFRRNAA